MKRSTDRILTTHTGRLDPPPDLGDMTRARQTGGNVDQAAYESRLRESIRDIVKRQVDTGIDVVSDGELGKFNSFDYYSRRMTGLKSRPVREGEPPGMWERTGERIEFAEFYEYLGFRTARQRMYFDGPISFIGEAEVQRDIEIAKAGLNGVPVEEAFMCVLAPGWLEHWMYNEYYKSDEEYLFAIAEP
jgi:5-methyltetrahydropteroyltriglutamate--homocysteine methyltransferase